MSIQGKMKPTHENLTYVEGKGHYRQKLDLYLPEDTSTPVPTILWLHGGSWSEGDKSTVPLLGLVRSNIAIASANYRFTHQAPFPAQIHDVKTAIRFLRSVADQYGLDPERIMAAGFSAGGHLASLAGCSHACVEFEGSELGYNEYSSTVCAVAAFGAPSVIRCTDKSQLAPDPDLAREASPVQHVSSRSPAFYIQHGCDDDVVDYRHAERLAETLAIAGVQHDLELIEGLSHKMKLGAHVLDKFKELLNCRAGV